MDECHGPSVTVLEGVCSGIPHMGTARVLEPGCGDGRLARDFSSKKWDAVDVYDRCQLAINSVLDWKDEVPAIKRCECSSMASFQSKVPYDAILMRWVSGYLRKRELTQQLAAWKAMLQPQSVVRTGTHGHTPYVIIMENVSADGKEYTHKGQRVRTEAKLEAVFERAGYCIVKKTARHELVKGWEPTVVWVLTPIKK